MLALSLTNTTTQSDPLRYFVPIALFAIEPKLLTSGLTFTHDSVRELVAMAKAKPGVINYAGAGSTSHLSGLLLTKNGQHRSRACGL